ncbi:GTPase RsgA [archaeon]|nr:GTPase RsgA [archaeon]
MAALWNIVVGTLKEADIVLEVADARCVTDTRSTKLEELVKSMNKKLVLIINKCDLVPISFLNEIKQNVNCSCVFVSAKKRKGTRELKDAIYMRSKKTKLSQVCLIGYPNTGKSSIINLLVRKQSAKASSQPGYTKSTQWIKLQDNIRLLDTPGVVPSEETFSVFKSGIRPETSGDIERYAEELLENIKHAQGNNLTDFYNIKYDDVDQFLETLAKKMGYMLKGGIPDTVKAARKLIIDWNNGAVTAWRL